MQPRVRVSPNLKTDLAGRESAPLGTAQDLRRSPKGSSFAADCREGGILKGAKTVANSVNSPSPQCSYFIMMLRRPVIIIITVSMPYYAAAVKLSSPSQCSRGSESQAASDD